MKMIFCVLDGFLISLLGGFLISLVRMIFCVLGGDTILRSIKVKQPGLVAPPPGGDWRSEGKVAPALEGAVPQHYQAVWGRVPTLVEWGFL